MDDNLRRAYVELAKRELARRQKPIFDEQQNISRVKQEHPYIAYFGEQLSKHPNLSKTVVGAADFLDPLRQGIEESGLPAAAGGAVRGLSRASQLPAKAMDYFTGQNTA